MASIKKSPHHGQYLGEPSPWLVLRRVLSKASFGETPPQGQCWGVSLPWIVLRRVRPKNSFGSVFTMTSIEKSPSYG